MLKWLNKAVVNDVVGIVLPAPEKGQINDRCKGIDKFQNEGFEDKALLKAFVCLWNLWKTAYDHDINGCLIC